MRPYTFPLSPRPPEQSSSPLPLGEGPGVRGVASSEGRNEGSFVDLSTCHDPHPGPLPKGEGGRGSAPRGVMVGLIIATLTAGAWAMAGPIPPGRQHRLSIEGENTVTFLPRVGLDPIKFDYKLKVEYIVDTRYGKETKPPADEEAKPPVEEVASKKAAAKKSTRAKGRQAETPASKVTGAIDLSLHSFERNYVQNGRAILETRASRSRFQGRVQPDAPAFDVTARDAPPALQEMILKHFDVVAASMLLNDDLKVVDRKYRFEGPQRAMVETLLSIHTPIPKGADSWESPTQLVMGHAQTARGMLRFEKQKPATDGKSTDLVKVKVSGVLNAEGVIAGNFIKDGRYTVTGDQVFDTHKHEWISARWSVAIVNELANQAGQPVARAEGSMIVESRLAEAGAPSTSEDAKPKL
jgi:hypothetical protein